MSDVKKTQVEETFEEEIKETTEKKVKFPRVRAFIGEHKKQLGIAAASVATVVAGALIAKRGLADLYDAGFEDGMAAAELDDSEVTVMTEIEVEPTVDDSTEQVEES